MHVSKSVMWRSLNELKAVEVLYKLALAVRSQIAVHLTTTSGSTERSDGNEQRMHNVK